MSAYRVRTEREDDRRLEQMRRGFLTEASRGVPVKLKEGDGRERAYRLRKDDAA